LAGAEAPQMSQLMKWLAKMKAAGKLSHLEEGGHWGGMDLSGIGRSWNSVGATYNKFDDVPKISSVPHSDLGDPKKWFYDVKDSDRAKRLADQIQHNARIEPIIVANDREGLPYVLEGQHRFVALDHLGHKEVPAKIVLGLDDLPDEEVGALEKFLAQLRAKK
jgi:hypothetical protein